MTKTKTKHKPLGPARKPHQIIVGKLALRNHAEEYLKTKLPAIGKRLFEYAPSDHSARLLKCAVVYAGALAEKPFLYSWSQYHSQLQLASKAGHKFLKLAGCEACASSDQTETAAVAPIERGVRAIIENQIPEGSKYFPVTKALVAAIDQAVTMSAAKKRSEPAPNSDFRSFLDTVVSIGAVQNLGNNLPQKTDANAQGSRSRKPRSITYPLFEFAVEAETLAIAAAKYALEKAPMTDIEASVVSQTLKPKSRGSMVEELRAALQRRRKRVLKFKPRLKRKPKKKK